jgi:hypothetical protein
MVRSQSLIVLALLTVQNITGYGVAYFYSGLPLDPFVNDLENFCSLMNDYGQKTMLLANVPLFQTVLNLTGQSEQVINISNGKAMDYRKDLDFESHRTGEQGEAVPVCLFLRVGSGKH